MRRPSVRNIAPSLIVGLALACLAACAPPEVAPPGSGPAPALVRFGVAADVHYADVEAREGRPYRESLAKFKEFVAVMDQEKADFLIELGDFKDQDVTPVESKTMSYLRRIESAYEAFPGPRYHVLGNHDVDSLSKSQFLGTAGNPGVPADWSFYGFDVRGFRFLVLDADFTAAGAPYDHGKFAWADCSVPAVELDWLRSELTATPKPVIVFIHQQLDGQGDYYVKNAAAVRAILEQSGKVRAVFQGHRHEGAFSKIKGIPYVTFKGMIEGSGPENSAYALVEADPRGDIAIKGFRKADSLRLGKEPS
jgi:predicted phosphodiesterase